MASAIRAQSLPKRTQVHKGLVTNYGERGEGLHNGRGVTPTKKVEGGGEF